jgi:hypothetical protein
MDEKQQAVLRDYAWRYFSMHADQRLKTFGFYVTLATLVGGAFVAMVKEHTEWKWLSILPFLLTFMTFVFWKFESRNKQLVRNGEAALKHLDELLPLEKKTTEPHVLCIFARDDYLSGQVEGSPIKRKWTYSRCFNAVFLVFGISSFILGIVCLFH